MRKAVGGFITSRGEVVSSRKAIQASFLSRKLGLKDTTLEYQRAQQTRSQEQIEKAKDDLRIGRNLPNNYKHAGFLWGAITNKYFAVILRPLPDNDKDYCDWLRDKTSWFYNPDRDSKANTGDETVGINLEIATTELSVNDIKQYKFMLYLGPKNKTLFDKNQLYNELGFIQTIDFIARWAGWPRRPRR
jgi:hypothetical protein